MVYSILEPCSQSPSLNVISCTKLELIHRQTVPVERSKLWIMSLMLVLSTKSPHGASGLQELDDETISWLNKDLPI